MNDPLAVLWEDPHGLAVDKPAGLLTQGPSSGEITLEELVRRHLRPDNPGSAYLGTVHRLDRPVSGVILWAKTPKAARRWASQFVSRQAHKEYWAIVEGNASALGGSGTWDDWLMPPDAMGRSRVVEAGHPGATRAVTRFEVVREHLATGACSWLKLRPETGRTHQLRAQSSARGLPIVGDSTYGASRAFPQGIALHAQLILAVEHPILRRSMLIEAPTPGSWSGWLG